MAWKKLCHQSSSCKVVLGCVFLNTPKLPRLHWETIFNSPDASNNFTSLMADKLCWRAAVSMVYVAADSSWLSCTHKSKQQNCCWFAECCAILHVSEVVIHLKLPTINILGKDTLSNTLSNAFPSLINNECCKYLYIQVAAQPCVTDQNQITPPWMACKRPGAVSDADCTMAERNARFWAQFTLAIGKHLFSALYERPKEVLWPV